MTTCKAATTAVLVAIAILCAGLASAQKPSGSSSIVELPEEVLRDKIRGGLLGQMLGNLNGIDHEMRYINEPGNVTAYEPALPEGAWTDDDTDFEWVYIDAMQRHGELFVPHGEIADLWRTRINRRIWCSNQYARVLMDLDIEPPMTGSIALNPWAEFNISGQFLCESFGLIAPGMPQTAGRIGLHYTRVAIDGEPAQTTQMFTAMIATAFLTDDVEGILDAGVAALDSRSVLREIVGNVRTWHDAHPDDWPTTRRLVKEKYSRHGGEMRDRNGYELNTASTIAALAYGAGDFAETLRHAFNFGWDADNNAATAGTVVGVMKGYRWMMAQGWDIRDRYRNETRDGMPEDETITSFADRLIEVAERVIIEHGGARITDRLPTVYRIPVEEPATVYPLPVLSGQMAQLQAQMKDDIESAILDGPTSRAQARAVYLAIVLDLADSIRARRPEQWSRALAMLNEFPQMAQVLYHHSPVPAAEPIRERARRAGLEPPAAEGEEWMWRATTIEGRRYVSGEVRSRTQPVGRTAEKVEISRDVLLDKIRGGWVGKAYGVALGGPTEFRYIGTMVEGPLEMKEQGLKWVPEQDDLYVNMVFLKVVADHGFDAPASAFADAFAHANFGLGHANAQARQNLLAGIPPDKSGHPRYSAHAEDIDFQIEADFIGLISPGLPQAAWKLCDRVGHIMNYGDGVYGGVFASAMYEAAFIRNDPQQIVESALNAIPQDSGYAQVIQDVLRWHKQYPNDWKANWQEIQVKWGHEDRCPWGVTGAHGSLKGMFNISARLNGAYIVLGLLYGNGDMEKTMEIATRAGQDSDCNPSTAGGVLGTALGFSNLPEVVKTAIAPYMNVEFSNTVYTIESASEECLQLAIANVKANGGRELDGRIQINVQSFQAPAGPAEVAFANLIPSDGFWVTDNRIVWKGEWSEPRGNDGTRSSSTAGDFMEVEFPGTAVYVQGSIKYDSGILEVFVDGESMGTRDMHMTRKWTKSGFTGQVTAVWLTGLPDGAHTLQVRVTGRKNPESEGTVIRLGRIACYRGHIE